jgi:D-arginine dehydrogenase
LEGAIISDQFDICVIGGGMAGLSVSAGLAGRHRVVLLEREPHFAYHSTGRSAALFAESYGNGPIRALTRASREFFFRDSAEAPFTQPREAMFVAAAGQTGSLSALHAELSLASSAIRILDSAAARERCPILRASTVEAALLDPDARDIDVARVVDFYARAFKSRGGEQRRGEPVAALERDGGGWRVRTESRELRALIVIDAAGAWADSIALAAGVAPVRLEPCRRTAVRVSTGSWDAARWPMVVDSEEQWYFRADAGALMLSPADETPSEPCDAQPDDYDVALAIERVEAATTLVVDRPLSSWAGLRTFAADRTPVVGFDAAVPGFFWLAGQGGYGIQAAPALAELAVALIEERPVPAELAEHGVDAAALSPQRLR